MLSLTLFYRKGLPFLNEHGLFVISIYTNYVTLSIICRMMIINRRFCFKIPLNNVYFDKTIFKVSVILLNHIGNYFTFFTIYDALIGLYMNIAHKKDVKKRRNMSS